MFYIHIDMDYIFTTPVGHNLHGQDCSPAGVINRESIHLRHRKNISYARFNVAI